MTKQNVPLLDLTRMDPELEQELLEAFKGVLKTGRYIMGPEVLGLEQECAEYVDAQHGVGVSSGTDALLACLMALNIGPGDEVICPSYSFFATAGSIWRTGAKPVFVDVLPDSYNCDPKDIERKLSPKTKAIIPVHLFGQCADMQPITELARAHNVHVIEDAAQALGAEYQGKRAGALGDYACFSFFPSKNLGGFGDGGLITTNDEQLAESARLMRAHGGKPKYYHKVVGGNFRLDALMAALLRPKLRRLEAATEQRQKNADRYTQLFTESGVATPNPAATPGTDTGAASKELLLPVANQTRHIYNQYVLQVRDASKRDALQQHLRTAGVGTEIYYPVPLHLQDCFAELKHREGDFPVSEEAAKSTLAIPVFPELRKEELEYVVESVTSYFGVS